MMTRVRTVIGIPDRNSIYSLPHMRTFSRIARIALLAIAFCAILACGLLLVYRTHSERLKASRYESMDGWQAISGRWNENAGVLSNSNYGRGDMLIAQHS